MLLQNIVPFGDRELDSICSCFSPRSLNRHEILLNSGNVCKEFYYVHTGCLRTYFIDRTGREKTRYVMPDCSIGTALTSFITQQPSSELLEALEDTEVLAISYESFFRLNRENDNWNSFYKRILEMAYTFQNRRIEHLLTLTAQQRYELIRGEHPLLLQKLSNRMLAPYLDIREETLSRLKSRC